MTSYTHITVANDDAEKKDQQAAGDMVFYTVARTQNGHLSALFAAADGVRLYSLHTLLETGPFDHMTKFSQKESRKALALLYREISKVNEGRAVAEDYPAPEEKAEAAVSFREKMAPL